MQVLVFYLLYARALFFIQKSTFFNVVICSEWPYLLEAW